MPDGDCENEARREKKQLYAKGKSDESFQEIGSEADKKVAWW